MTIIRQTNKLILGLLKNKVKELSSVALSHKAKIDILANFISKIQSVDLITIKQNDERTKVDRTIALSKDVRDKILDNHWYILVIE